MKSVRVLLLALFVCANASAQTPRNIILIIGDGTGPAHYTAARLLRGDDFQIGRMPVVGLQMTAAEDAAVTDSAAAASALATGHKVRDEAVSLDRVTGKRHETVLEAAERAGKVTGLVTTADFFDATPAAFAAHVADRHDFIPDIVRQMVSSGAELIVGGGLHYFGRNDRPALEDLVHGSGFTLVHNAPDLEASKAAHVLAVFPSQPRNMDFANASLPQLAAWAINRLAGDPNGFFLMIEHEGTDSASHQNHSADVRDALTSLDKAVGVALDFASKRNDTLVVVTGDHESGGLRITETRERRRPQYEWSTIHHTAVAIPVFAFGPGSTAFAGFYDNTDIGRKLLQYVRRP